MSDAPDVCGTAVVKMTLGYDEQEDRIYLDCLTPNLTQIRLWVTQRLMQRLVRHLECSTVSHMLGNSRQDISTGIAAPNHEDPVPAGLHCQSFLVSSVDVSTRDSDILLAGRAFVRTSQQRFLSPSIRVETGCAALCSASKRQGGLSTALNLSHRAQS